ncbi:MAG: hypothetical protein FWE36_07935 [Erysipelotrichales bacterium]|nr:hypothetical protein [Erysipelotrichales bacterium]
MKKQITVKYVERSNLSKGYLVEVLECQLKDLKVGRQAIITSRGNGRALVSIVSLEALGLYNHQSTVDNGNKLIQVLINAKEDCQNELYKVEGEIYKLNAEFKEKYSMLFYLKIDAPVIDEMKGKMITLVTRERELKAKLSTLTN